MIIKERSSAEHTATDKFSKAGAKAEQQMAFYLQRAFMDDKYVWVLNDLRLEDDTGDAAQIDHLVIHRYGFIIIESKSVCTKVKINEHQEWLRLWSGHYEGMPSPVQQAKRQIEFLRRALNANREELVKKMFGLVQKGFIGCPMEIVVAISDKGMIDRGTHIPEVVKADQVPDKVREICQRHKKAAGPLGINTSLDATDGLYSLNRDEISAISAFLIDHHQPLAEPITYPESTPAAACVRETAPAPPQTDGLGLCTSCGNQCEILWGRYSYYWKCPQCEINMPIKEYCPTCRTKMKLRKDGDRFHILCEPCETERLYCEFDRA